MTEPLDEAVAHLRTLSIHLNDVTDQATTGVRRVEIFLNQECRLGLAAHVPITASGPDLPTLQLGYAHNGDRFRIVVRGVAYLERAGQVVRNETTNAPVIAHEEQVPWADCARATTVAAFQQLPALLTALQAQVAEVITRADAAVAAASTITGALGEAPASDADDDRNDDERRHRGDEGRHGGRHHGHGHGHGHAHGHGHHHGGHCTERDGGRHHHGHAKHRHHSAGNRGESADPGEAAARGGRVS